MRDMEFTEKNLFNRLCSVNSFRRLLEGETKQYVKARLERAMREDVTVHLGRGYARGDISRRFWSGIVVGAGRWMRRCWRRLC